eukprot:9013891-Heterocapsa_arctica.AAC.1
MPSTTTGRGTTRRQLTPSPCSSWPRTKPLWTGATGTWPGSSPAGGAADASLLAGPGEERAASFPPAPRTSCE